MFRPRSSNARMDASAASKAPRFISRLASMRLAMKRNIGWRSSSASAT